MLLIIGLGNPGEKFENTRHNIGFKTVDFFVVKNNLDGFKVQKKYNAMVSENDGMVLVKPQTFMNESGSAVKKIIKNQPKPDLVVIHDDIDLPLGKLKISKNSGAGGHKGVESLINNLGTNNFIRFKIGICPIKGKPKSVESFVIKKFTANEQKVIDETIARTSEALDFLIKEGLEKTMNEYNR